MFSHLKYETKDILIILLIINAYFSIQNIKSDIYLRLYWLQIPVFLSKI